METNSHLPFCPPPAAGPGDVVPLLVVAALFLLAAWFIRWRKNRTSGK